MNRIPLVLLGIFAVLAASFSGLILSNQLSYGALAPFVVKDDNKVYPELQPGIAAQGKLVYQDLGCVTCHTQQVRRPGAGVDDKRGWGERQSVARDYLREERVLLGSLRAGPDLRNVGARKPDGGRAYDAAWHFKHLYDARLTSPGSNMPPYRFLFETREIVGQPSPRAISLPAPYGAPAGFELLPSPRAEALVAYLLSLKDTFDYPEEAAKIYVAPAKTEKPAAGEHAEPKQTK